MDSLAPGQLALLDVFATICRGVDSQAAERILHEIANRDQHSSLSSRLSELDEQARSVEALKRQNVRLQADLARALQELGERRERDAVKDKKGETALVKIVAADLRDVSARTTRDGILSTPSLAAINLRGERSVSPMPDGLEKADLSRPEVAAAFKDKFRRISQAYENANRAREVAVQKWREKSDCVKQWVAHADGLQKRLDKATKIIKTDPENHVGGSSPLILPSLPHVALEIGQHQQDFVQERSPEPTLPTSHRHSDSTEDGNDFSESMQVDKHPQNTAFPFIKEESPDLPVVVSSRVIKKRLAIPTELDIERHLGTKLKQELFSSSSPIGIARLAGLTSYESMDLDEDAHVGITPKKTRYNDPTPRAIPKLKRSGQAQLSNGPSIPDAAFGYEYAIKALREQENQRAAPQTHVAPSRAPLQPRTTNSTVLPRTSTGPIHSKKRRRAEDVMKAAELLGEDGESPSVRKVNERKPNNLPASEERSKRLGSLLEAPSPQRQILASKLAEGAATRSSGSFQDDRGIVSRDAATTADSNGQTLPNPKTPHVTSVIRSSYHAPLIQSGEVNVTTPTSHNRPLTGLSTTTSRGQRTREEQITLEANDPVHEPFRARPLQKLSLEHFKVNPSFNEGLNYAFQSVVRGREQRKCLEGCTKPECCGGKFRAMAELLATNAGTPTMSQEERDLELMEDYLGPEKARLDSMSDEDKKEVLLQAQSRELSRRHGKHRFTYERRKSPPGFWRADFPSTQEEQADREKAVIAERDLVGERWKEAMRDGGKWLFRDE